MGRKYKKKSKTKSRQVRKYRPRRSLPLGGFPSKHVARLKYVDLIQLSPTALGSAVPTFKHFRANSLYDPDYSGIGHQPRGFDELSAIYDHYCVIGSKIKVFFENDVDSVNNAGQYCFLMLQDTAGTPTSLIDIMEESNKNKIGYKQRSSTTSQNVMLSKTFSPYKMFGIPKKDSLINNSNLNPQTQQNPLEDAIYTAGIACSRTTSTIPPSVTLRVEIEYIAVFTEKRPMVQS